MIGPRDVDAQWQTKTDIFGRVVSAVVSKRFLRGASPMKLEARGVEPLYAALTGVGFVCGLE
jgi:hypothetical protein